MSDGYGTVTPTPNTPETIITLPVVNMKPATPDLIQFNDAAIPIETMTNLVMEDIGGQELINISRRDIINGQDILYSPIKNLAVIGSQYNPLTIFNLFGTSQTTFGNFAISLESHIPDFNSGTGSTLPALSGGQIVKDSVYLDSSGNLVIDVIGMSNEDQVEVEVLSTTTTFLNTVW